METVAQGATFSDLSDPILDALGNPITTGAANITVTLFDSANVDRSAGITKAHVSGGRYRITKAIPADAALGAWGGILTYDDGVTPAQTQTIDFAVVTALETGLAAAVAALQAKLGAASVVQVPITNTSGVAVWSQGE